MKPEVFVAKWQAANLTERSASHQHFLDLCDLLGHEKPAEADPDGSWFTFDRYLTKTTGEQGWADVWKQGCFAWEYKGRKRKHKNLTEAYRQLLLYREDLENPPLLVVSDIKQTQVHTNFTNTAKKIYTADIKDFANPLTLNLFRKVFKGSNDLRPDKTPVTVTQSAAADFAKLADGMRDRGVPVRDAARFLMRLMFCMFTEDIDLLPDHVFRTALKNFRHKPRRLAGRLRVLFRAMATGGAFGPEPILHFNGGLFADPGVVELTPSEIGLLLKVSNLDWGSVEPSIFGTLFERTLDPEKRDQIGTHFTGGEDVRAVLEPVVMVPLRREWDDVRGRCDQLWDEVQERLKRDEPPKKRPRESPQWREFCRLLPDFVQRLSEVKLADFACGSGNFLYTGLRCLLDLEKEVRTYAANHQASVTPCVTPLQLVGMETNPFAQELAQVVIWIGHLQWKYQNGYSPISKPVLDPFDSVRCADAILDLTDPENPKEPEWPEADFIVGNPPFLGGSKIRRGLGDQYANALFEVYQGRVPASADLCCYWFEKARAQIEAGKSRRAGLLATQGIRGGASRKVLKRIKQTGSIFFAESDRPWISEGISVHVSLVGFGEKGEAVPLLDGREVSSISADLSTGSDVTQAMRLPGMTALHIEGVKKGADFEVNEADALKMLSAPNPHRQPNSNVVRPYFNGQDLIRSRSPSWVLYFPPSITRAEAALYERPFEHVKARVFPHYGTKRKKWWLHERPRPELTKMLGGLRRYFATVKHAKHRLFMWLPPEVLVSNAIELFACDDSYVFGILHSRVHEVWARRQATQVRERESGLRYTPSTCFETFPFPKPAKGQRTDIADAAQKLDHLRNDWLNPPEWTRQEILEFPGSVDGPWERYVHEPDGRGIGIVHYPRLVPKDAEVATTLSTRTLTSLYNEYPTWLQDAHCKLDEAVSEAYDWKPGLKDEEILAGMLELNLSGAAASPQGKSVPVAGETVSPVPPDAGQSN